MDNYIQIEFNKIQSDQSDLLIALLSNIGFNGFEEKEDELIAFIPVTEFDEKNFQRCIQSLGISFSKKSIQETNWNQVWESNFPPVIVDDFVAIRAEFHEPIQNVELEIIITPKMSFGTGHHSTTRMMIEQMKELNFDNKVVFDFGTGTGVLAIIAEKLGAKRVLAIDNDKWSLENARENIKRNNCKKIELQRASSASVNEDFDIILANINKNVILDNLDSLTQQLSEDGILILSGLLPEDEQDVISESSRSGLLVKNKILNHNWLFIKLSR